MMASIVEEIEQFALYRKLQGDTKEVQTEGFRVIVQAILEEVYE